MDVLEYAPTMSIRHSPDPLALPQQQYAFSMKPQMDKHDSPYFLCRGHLPVLPDLSLLRPRACFSATPSLVSLVLLPRRLQGSWAPSMNVPTLLTTIRLLMAHPNGDDGLMPDIVSFRGSSCCLSLVFCRGILVACLQAGGLWGVS